MPLSVVAGDVRNFAVHIAFEVFRMGYHCTALDSHAAPAGLLFFELMFVTFRTLFVALFTWPEEMLIIKKVGL